jgi:hypothetical protein
MKKRQVSSQSPRQACRGSLCGDCSGEICDTYAFSFHSYQLLAYCSRETPIAIILHFYVSGMLSKTIENHNLDMISIGLLLYAPAR